MRKKKNHDSHVSSWLDTYADMVTLLLTFFVMLYAMSSIDAGKWQLLVKAFQGEFAPGSVTEIVNVASNGTTLGDSSVIAGNDSSTTVSEINTNPTEVTQFDELYYYIKNYVDENAMSGTVSVYQGDGYTFITFQNNVFFDGDSATIRDDGKAILNFLAGGLKGITKEIGEIRFYGHTAHVSNGSTLAQQVFDRQLSTNRANNVLLYIQLKDIIQPKKLIAEGYGEYRPLVKDDGTEATRVKNRRVEICISKVSNINLTLDNIYDKINSFNASSSVGTSSK